MCVYEKKVPADGSRRATRGFQRCRRRGLVLMTRLPFVRLIVLACLCEPVFAERAKLKEPKKTGNTKSAAVDPFFFEKKEQ
jgi:hypothetical protein